MADRPDVVVFDVLETLLNLDPLRTRLEEVGQPAALLGPWFMRFQEEYQGQSIRVMSCFAIACVGRSG